MGYSRQRMPELREDDGQRSQERANGRKHKTDFRGLVFGDQVRGQILKHILKLTRARSRVIFSAGYICNFLQRRFINPSAEPAAAKLPATAAASKLPTAAKSLPTAKRLVTHKLLAAIRKV